MKQFPYYDSSFCLGLLLGRVVLAKAMPSTSRSKKKPNLRKSILEKQHAEAVAPIEATKSRSRVLSATTVQYSSESADSDEVDDKKRSRRTRSGRQNKTCPAIPAATEKSLDVTTSPDEEEDISTVDVREAVKHAVNKKRLSSENKENVPVSEVNEKSKMDGTKVLSPQVNNTTSTRRSKDARKSIDHATKRKNLQKALSEYSREQLESIVLESEDKIAEMNFKMKSISLKVSQDEEVTKSTQQSHRKNLELVNENQNLKMKIEYFETILKDKLEELEKTNEEMKGKISHLTQLNTELTQERDSLSSQITQLKEQRLEAEKKTTEEVHVLKSENSNNSEEMKKLSTLVEELKQQVQTLESAKGDLSDQLELRTQESESHSNQLVAMKADQELQASEYCKLQEVNKQLLEYQAKLEENQQNASHKDPLSDERDILEQLTQNAPTGSPTYVFTNNSIKTYIENNSDEHELMALYKELIYDLQEVLEMYSFLSGMSVWKGVEDDLYHCQLNSVLGTVPYSFDLKVDWNNGLLTYSPEEAESKTMESHLPGTLLAAATFKCGEAHNFLRGVLLDVDNLSQ